MANDPIETEARQVADEALAEFTLASFIEDNAHLPSGEAKISLNTKAAHRRAELLDEREKFISESGGSVGGDSPFDGELAQVQAEIEASTLTVEMRALPESERDVLAKLVRQEHPKGKTTSGDEAAEIDAVRTNATAERWINKSITALTFPNGQRIEGPVSREDFERLWDVLHESQKSVLEAKFGALSLAKTIFDAEVDAGFPG